MTPRRERPDHGRWRSPLRGPWLTALFSVVLLVGLPVVIVTGLLDFVAYGPRLGQAMPRDVGWLHLPYFSWPTRPVWLFRVTQGTHVVLGLVLVPVVLAKLWSVMPKLFAWPPVRSPAHLLERLSLVLVVGGVIFEMATGILNIQYDYVFGFSFYTAHYYGAWVFAAGLVLHVALKATTMVRSLRSRSLRRELRTSLADTYPEASDDGLVPVDPAAPTLSRRGALATVGGAAAMVGALTVGQVIGGPFRRFAVLLPRGHSYGDGPNDFQVNKTAVTAGISHKVTGPAWRLHLSGGHSPVTVSRAELLAMHGHTAALPIACVEGWSTTQTWTGVRLSDLAQLAGVPKPSTAHVQSLQHGGFNQVTLAANQVRDPDSLLALAVNGAELSLDHGYPARLIVPDLPGVHNTKWVASIHFAA